jgi:ankyrin repeat protein
MVASLFGHLPVVLRLVKGGDAGVEISSPLGRTPLHYAALGGHAEVVAALRQAGARAEVLDIGGRSALDLASEIDAEDVMQLLNSC